jgi:ribosome-associated heat shock protein Hsp15
MDKEFPSAPGVRLDKWLWAARFFKTRALVHAAIDAGHVRLNGDRAKPSRDLKPGDRLDIRNGETAWIVTVARLATQRGPAPVARTLYEETPESIAARERYQEQQRLAADPGQALHGRPTKRDRRLIHRFTAS